MFPSSKEVELIVDPLLGVVHISQTSHQSSVTEAW